MARTTVRPKSTSRPRRTSTVSVRTRAHKAAVTTPAPVRVPAMITAPATAPDRRMMMWTSVVVGLILVIVLWVVVNPLDTQDGVDENPLATLTSRFRDFFSSTSLPSAEELTATTEEDVIKEVEREVFPEFK